MSCVMACLAMISDISTPDTQARNIAIFQGIGILGAPLGSISQGLISQHLGLSANVIIYIICHVLIILYVCTYLTKRYGLSYMPQAPAEEETIFQSTISLFKKTVQTLIMKRPNRSYIIIAVVSDLIMRLTFTGDIGTLYPYLTLPKFAFSRQDYGFLLGVRQLSQSLILLISYVWLIKSRRMESIIAQVCNVLFIIGAIGMFSTWYIATPIPLIWLSNVLSGVPRSNRSN